MLETPIKSAIFEMQRENNRPIVPVLSDSLLMSPCCGPVATASRPMGTFLSSYMGDILMEFRQFQFCAHVDCWHRRSKLSWYLNLSRPTSPPATSRKRLK